MAKTEIYIYPLTGNRKSIRDYAKDIANMDFRGCNAYVMAFDGNNEVIWVIQAGDIDQLNEINFNNVKRVEIYDHSMDTESKYKYEYVYVDAQKYLDSYIHTWEYNKQMDGYDYCIMTDYRNNK